LACPNHYSLRQGSSLLLNISLCCCVQSFKGRYMLTHVSIKSLPRYEVFLQRNVNLQTKETDMKNTRICDNKEKNVVDNERKKCR
jgi:hypothetical protein